MAVSHPILSGMMINNTLSYCYVAMWVALAVNYLNIYRFTGLPTPTYPSGPITHSEQYKASGIAPVKRKSLVPDAETLV